MKYYTINYFNEKTETYCGGDLKCAMRYVEMRLDLYISSTFSKGLTVEISDEYGVVAELPYKKGVDEIGEYFERLDWVVLRK